MANYQQYAEYKELESIFVEKIPANWSVKPLYTLCGFKQGKAHEPFIDDDGEFICVNARFVSTQGKGGSIKRCNVNLTFAKLNDILMVMSDLPNGRALARAFYVTEPKNNYAVNQRVCVITAREVHAKFLYYQLNRSPYFLMFDDGSNQTHLSNDSYKKYPVILPSTIEQTQIVNFLDYETAQIDTLIEKQQTLIQLLKEKRQAVISHAVTKGLNPDAPMKDSGVEWLDEVPEHWTVSFVKYIVLGEKDSMVDGPFGSSVNTSEDYVDDGIPVIRTVNITNNGFSSDNLKFMRQQKFDQLKRHSVKPGDVLFSKVGTIGNACLLPSDIPEAILSTTGSCKISVDQNKIEGEYLVLMFHLMNQTLMEMANSNVQPFLNMSNIKNLKISLPSIEEQKNILTYLEEKLEGIDDLIAKSLSFDKLIRERRTALISAAVTGKIDVRGWRAPE